MQEPRMFMSRAQTFEHAIMLAEAESRQDAADLARWGDDGGGCAITSSPAEREAAQS